MWARAALGTLIIALVCGATAWRHKIAISVFQEELPTEAFRVFGVQRIPVLETCEEKDFQQPIHCGAGLIFWHLQLNGIFGGKGTCNTVNNDDSASIKNDPTGHFFGQSVACQYAEPDIFYRKGASTCISETPKQIYAGDSILVRLVFKTTNCEFHKINIGLLRLGCDFGHFFLGLCGFNVGVRTSLDGCGLPRNSLGLKLGFRSLLFQSSYLFADRTELIGHSIGLPFGLNGQIRQIADGAFNVASVACNTIGSNSDNEHCSADKAVNKINDPNFTPKHFIGRALVLLGAVLAGIGLLWLIIAARLNLTLADAGWRGILAICLFGFGAILIWQGVSLTFAI